MSRRLGQHRMDDRIREVTACLVSEYRGAWPPGTVLRCVARCRYQLRQAGIQAGLDQAVEAMARHRLRQLREIRVAG
jgi:hypothetical protein